MLQTLVEKQGSPTGVARVVGKDRLVSQALEVTQ
jgi:hypothetical protein